MFTILPTVGLFPYIYDAGHRHTSATHMLLVLMRIGPPHPHVLSRLTYVAIFCRWGCL
jgi:hypothetical protein